ncbi:hypothetical protein EOA27_38575 [Mesorhizobium sp. M2A.F.Ca.ET.037.01.1.1]|uniref:hypothetical protein n=1 Tax=Mesorhizobium sp. M2A.F.Ca.ET.037.01.1.1 TaxID=2496748 RepID=UPI000FCB43AA|nr:hypothetical protein [Mesorhizobium sp. M2A.F.Ca.ET.037.01.1.1]RUW96608.1 hypothetical protein EOA27_38575 [Mesorhizobium sp. M2A.F.Ca.ET.037.01.1.1]
MSDTAFKTAPYGSYTTATLRVWAEQEGVDTAPYLAEIARREAVAAGDVSVMTPGERLRFIRHGKAR